MGLKDRESEKLSDPQAENTDSSPLSVRYYQHRSMAGVKKILNILTYIEGTCSQKEFCGSQLAMDPKMLAF